MERIATSVRESKIMSDKKKTTTEMDKKSASHPSKIASHCTQQQQPAKSESEKPKFGGKSIYSNFVKNGTSIPLGKLNVTPLIRRGSNFFICSTLLLSP